MLPSILDVRLICGTPCAVPQPVAQQLMQSLLPHVGWGTACVLEYRRGYNFLGVVRHGGIVSSAVRCKSKTALESLEQTGDWHVGTWYMPEAAAAALQ